MAVTGLAEVERVKEVNEQMGELDSAIASLSATLDKLEPKLEKVLSVPSPMDKDKAEIPEEGLCKLAQEIRSFRYRIENMSAGVRNVFSRLEL